MFDIQEDLHTHLQPFSLKTPIEDAKDFFKKHSYSHFPILDHQVFLGNIDREDVETLSNESLIGDYRMLFLPFFLRENANWFEVLETFSINNTNLIPVLNTENRYIGYLKEDEIYEYFQTTPFIKENGSVLIVQKSIYDYSISQIAQIVEVNNAKLLGVVISEIIEDKAQITIKMISNNINEIIQSLRRYDYEIISEHTEDQYLTELKDRSAYLDKYLNI